MEAFALFFIALYVLALNFQILRILKRLRVCEDRHAAIDVLAEQVCDMSADFYGSSD